ncbi:MAG: phage holin family protein [Chloroflexi bacterium]|nr:phage holin family protein [Chloroflexota bacterium]
MDARRMERDDRSLGQLFGDLSQQLGTLVRKEIELARTEVTDVAMRVARDATMLGAGAVLVHAAGLLGLVAIALLLAELGLAPWLAFLVVAIVVGVLGGVLIQVGRDQLQRRELVPRQTIETVKEDVEWARERVK